MINRYPILAGVFLLIVHGVSDGLQPDKEAGATALRLTSVPGRRSVSSGDRSTAHSPSETRES